MYLSDNKNTRPRNIRKIFAHLFSDLSILVGIIGIAAGAGMIYPPAGFIVAGAELIALGYLTSP